MRDPREGELDPEAWCLTHYVPRNRHGECPDCQWFAQHAPEMRELTPDEAGQALLAAMAKALARIRAAEDEQMGAALAARFEQNR